MYIIYCWKSPTGDILYVGKTKNPNVRKRRYIRKADPAYPKTHNLRAIHMRLRSDWQNINEYEFAILAKDLSSEEATAQEKLFINQYDTFNNGFNKTKHG